LRQLLQFRRKFQTRDTIRTGCMRSERQRTRIRQLDNPRSEVNHPRDDRNHNAPDK
jgi:hypothetical protein